MAKKSQRLKWVYGDPAPQSWSQAADIVRANQPAKQKQPKKPNPNFEGDLFKGRERLKEPE